MDKLGAIAVGNRGIQLSNMDDVFRFAKAVAGSQLCPPGFSERDCFLVIANGLEVGMSPMAALQSTYIVNNRATIFGDMPLALVRQSGLLEDYKQEYVGKAFDDDYRCIVTSKRKGTSTPITTEYSVKDARTAELWTKKGPWTTAPKRMLLYRARGFNLKDNFSDVLKGCAIAELDDGVGFDNAREAVGRVVEPHFSAPAVSETSRLNLGETRSAVPDLRGPEPPAKRGPGRPRKEKPEEVLFGPSAEMAEQKPETETPAADLSKEAKQILGRLADEKIPVIDFLLVMEKCAFLDATPEAIRNGQVEISAVSAQGLSDALENWEHVLTMLPEIKA
jgi:hypothetical protein